MKIYELIKLVEEYPEKYMGNEYKIIRGRATGWCAGADMDFGTFIISKHGTFSSGDYCVAFSPDVEVEFISKKESIDVDDKVFEVAEKIKKSSNDILRDYDRDYINYDFTEGCIISNNILLDFISEIWDVDLTNYYTPNNLPRRR